MGGGTSRKVKQVYIGNGNTARKVVKAYIGVNGTAKQFWPSIQYKWNRYSIAWGTTSYTADEIYIGSEVYANRSNRLPAIVDGLFDTDGMALDSLSGVIPGVIRVINATRTMCCIRTDYRDGYFRVSGGRLSVYHETMTVYTPVETQGELIDTITASSPDAYPTNGVSGDYWYVYQGEVS